MAGPLDTLKILDLTALLPGPFATLYLSDLGASVLRVTSASRPDTLETRHPIVPGKSISAVSAYLGRGKLSLSLNLKHPQAAEIVRRLIEEYDIVIEQFRPGVMARLGLDYQSLSKLNPAVIYCSLTNFGQTGPLCHRAGHDINMLARSGIASYSGKQESGPAMMGMQIADLAAGSLNAVIGILAAVIKRRETGEGQHIDISMTDGMMAFNALYGASFLGGASEPVREGERLNGGVLYDFYETRDGEYMSLGALEPQFFKAFCEKIGRTDLTAGGIHPVDVDRVKEEIRVVFKSRTRDEWVETFRDVDACVEPVVHLSEALNGGHAKAREMVIDIKFADGGSIRQVANPIKFSRSKQEYSFAGAPGGSHTKMVVLGLGYTEDEYKSMEAAGAFS
ncbi:MAG: CoA transferase [Desulfomonile tiedjei]|nr:CoA transferase [Desulfomonile tiedjei]